MGCDIHLVLERKYGLKWIAVDTFAGHETSYSKGWASPLATSRNYDRFAALANVRSDNNAGLRPRGIPADASETTLMIFEDWEGDAHSASWLPLEEATPIFLATEHGLKEGDFATKYPQSHFFGVDESSATEAKRKYRIIFWFDN